jgi:hypothetical protein
MMSGARSGARRAELVTTPSTVPSFSRRTARELRSPNGAVGTGSNVPIHGPTRLGRTSVRRVPRVLTGEDGDDEHDWIVEERRRVAELELRALEAYGPACRGLGGTELAAAMRVGSLLVAAAPVRESGTRLLMRPSPPKETAPRRCRSPKPPACAPRSARHPRRVCRPRLSTPSSTADPRTRRHDVISAQRTRLPAVDAGFGPGGHLQTVWMHAARH